MASFLSVAYSYCMSEACSNIPGDLSPAEAIPLLYDEYVTMVRGLASRICGDPSKIDDIVQDTFLEAFQSWSSFEGRSKPSTWLATIAIRQCHRRLRRRAGEPATLPSLEDLLPFGETTSSIIPTEDEDPLDASVREEALVSVRAAILALPVDFRIPLVMKELLQISVREVAEALGLKVETVKTRLHRARLRLRERMRVSLPQKQAIDPIYERQTCIDLMHAKLDALDAGRMFPVANEVLCERCLAVFRELDLMSDLCHAEAGTPEIEADRDRLRAAIVDSIGQSGETRG